MNVWIVTVTYEVEADTEEDAIAAERAGMGVRVDTQVELLEDGGYS